MSTESQTNSNRKNAKKSTGPRTAEGKARSSRNSTVHGLTGKSPILPGEDPADLRDLAAQYRDALHPQGQVEEDLVERMAVATYRLRRLAGIEVGFLDLRLRFKPLPAGFNQDGRADPLAWAFLNDHYGVLDRLGRHESRLQREYTRCLADLQKLQALRKKESVETKPKATVTPIHPTPSADSEVPEMAYSAASTAAAPPGV
jgi:hypothetical protein